MKKNKTASPKAVDAVKRGRASKALRGVFALLMKNKAISPTSGMPRGQIETEFNHRTKNKYKGSFNWALYNLFNERHCLSKQKKHGGGYYLNKKGIEVAKEYLAA